MLGIVVTCHATFAAAMYGVNITAPRENGNAREKSRYEETVGKLVRNVNEHNPLFSHSKMILYAQGFVKWYCNDQKYQLI